MSDIAIIAGAGELPVLMSKALPDAPVVSFAGIDTALECAVHEFARLGAFFDDLKSRGIARVVLVGKIDRPQMDPARMDAFTASIAPDLMRAMRMGDDGVLRYVLGLFARFDIAVVGAHEVIPNLTATEGHVAGPIPNDQIRADIDRGRTVLAALSPLDIGQGTVIEAGLCLGIETLQGTDALLRFVAQTPDHLRRGSGVLVKLPKAGQTLSVDMPAIGPNTILNAHNARLSGIAIAAGATLLLDRDRITALADQHAISVVAIAP